MLDRPYFHTTELAPHKQSIEDSDVGSIPGTSQFLPQPVLPIGHMTGSSQGHWLVLSSQVALPLLTGTNLCPSSEIRIPGYSLLRVSCCLARRFGAVFLTRNSSRSGSRRSDSLYFSISTVPCSDSMSPGNYAHPHPVNPYLSWIARATRYCCSGVARYASLGYPNLLKSSHDS